MLVFVNFEIEYQKYLIYVFWFNLYPTALAFETFTLLPKLHSVAIWYLYVHTPTLRSPYNFVPLFC